jgi:hypothetical protein
MTLNYTRLWKITGRAAGGHSRRSRSLLGTAASSVVVVLGAIVWPGFNCFRQLVSEIRTASATTTVAATAAVTPATPTTITATIAAAALGHCWGRHAAYSNHAERITD